MKYIFLSVFLLTSTAAQAEFMAWSNRQGPKSLKQKQDMKYQNIWTISDWFDQQHKTRLMDQWLAINSSSNAYEFFINAQATTYKKNSTTNGTAATETEHKMQRVRVGAYASIFGLEGEYLNSDEDYHQYEGSVHVRLLGKAQQGTNLTVFYGQRNRIEENPGAVEEEFRNQFAGSNLTINFSKYFGIEGLYKKYFSTKSNLLNKLEGDKIEASAFIDYGILRVYGTYFQDKDETYDNGTGQITETKRDGMFGGVKIFF